MKKYFVKILIISLNLLTGCNNENLNEKMVFKETEVVPLPLREIKEIDYFIRQIKLDSTKYFNIVKDAHRRNRPVKEILKEEAEAIESRCANIIRIENLIIKNPTWFEEIQNKAKQERMSIDSAIKREAMRHISITRK